MSILHSKVIPDRSRLISRGWLKLATSGTVMAPTGATIVRIGIVSSGGEGENLGGSGAFAYRKAPTREGEVFEFQIGQTHTGGNSGHSWVRRQATGEILAFADRGRGSGEVSGNAAYCVGDFVEGGQFRLRSGGDSTFEQAWGFGGRWAANIPSRACGPGGGGQGRIYPTPNIAKPAGAGAGVFEWYAGDPGF
jgi:hypothetical protein